MLETSHLQTDSALRPEITLTAWLTCTCGAEFTGSWEAVGQTKDQTCTICGKVWSIAWPGWIFQPREVTEPWNPQEPSPSGPQDQEPLALPVVLSRAA